MTLVVVGAVAGVVLLLAVAYLAAGVALASTLTRSKRLRVSGDPRDVRLRHEEASFAAADGLGLRGWFLESPGARAVVVLVHDAAGTRSDPGIGLLDLQRDYVRRGFHVLSFDLRGRGESEGRRDCLGGAELADVSGAAAYARRRSGGAAVILHGFGAGASLSLTAAARQEGVAAVIADSPAASMRDYVRRRHARAPRHLFALAALLARRLHGADLRAVEPLRTMPRLAETPVMFVHCEDNERVPIEHTLNLAAASLNGGDEIWRERGVGHCGSYLADRVSYLARCVAFIDRAVPARRLPAAAVAEAV